MTRHRDATALRRSLETRLKTRSDHSGLPLDRLRKEAALQRLLARVAATAPNGSWALKGGLAMLARIGPRARVTADADATWRTTLAALHQMLEDAAESELDDHFEFLVGAGRPIRAEGPEGGLRFPVRCLLAGRPFETLRLDVNLVPTDPRPLDRVQLRNLFDFTDLPPVVVPAVRVEQQLAEKKSTPTPATTATRTTAEPRTSSTCSPSRNTSTCPASANSSTRAARPSRCATHPGHRRSNHPQTHGPNPGKDSCATTRCPTPHWPTPTPHSPGSGNHYSAHGMTINHGGTPTPGAGADPATRRRSSSSGRVSPDSLYSAPSPGRRTP